MIITLCLLLFRKLDIRRQDTHKNGINRMNDIIIFMQNNFHRPLTVAKISESFYMNSEYFTRYFKKHMGIGPKEYLVALRMDHAKKLVCQSAMKISHISDTCGYSSLTTFLRDFKQTYGCTPMQMRGKEQ